MQIYNTLTHSKEPFVPSGPNVTMYVCGVTPYDTTHLGHARTYLVFDVLQRYLRFLGWPVRYVQNITDVDEPLFERARQIGVDYRALAEECIRVFLADLQDLNILLPERFPRVSEEIDEIIAMIARLLAAGKAYERDGSVYFRTRQFPAFGAMAGLPRDAMLAAQRETGDLPEDPHKEDPLDFLLWIAARPGEPTWESPWGPGRPGWHIECSEMAMRYLGTPIDIHGGGSDLIFPHHSSEMAQSESLEPDRPFARYWVHVGLVGMDGEKMSKSLGNLVFVRDLLPMFGPDAVRFYVLQFPYREEISYARNELAAAAERWSRIAAAVVGPTAEPAEDGAVRLRERCLAALDDDLDTPSATAALEALADLIHATGDPGARAILRSLLDTIGFRGPASTAPDPPPGARAL